MTTSRKAIEIGLKTFEPFLEKLQKLGVIEEYRRWYDVTNLLVGIVDEKASDKIINLLIDLDPFLAAQCLPAAKGVTTETEDRLIAALVEIFKPSRRLRRYILVLSVLKMITSLRRIREPASYKTEILDIVYKAIEDVGMNRSLSNTMLRKAFYG